MSAPVRIRAATDSELVLVLDSWMKSYIRRGEKEEAQDYGFRFQGHRQIVLRLIRRCVVDVAESVAVAGQAVGWICFEDGVTHYVYVKSPMRRFGVMRDLVQRAPQVGVYSHKTPAAKHVLQFGQAWKYDEYAAFLTPEERLLAAKGKGERDGKEVPID